MDGKEIFVVSRSRDWDQSYFPEMGFTSRKDAEEYISKELQKSLVWLDSLRIDVIIVYKKEVKD